MSCEHRFNDSGRCIWCNAELVDMGPPEQPHGQVGATALQKLEAVVITLGQASSDQIAQTEDGMACNSCGELLDSESDHKQSCLARIINDSLNQLGAVGREIADLESRTKDAKDQRDNAVREMDRMHSEPTPSLQKVREALYPLAQWTDSAFVREKATEALSLLSQPQPQSEAEDRAQAEFIAKQIHAECGIVHAYWYFEEWMADYGIVEAIQKALAAMQAEKGVV